jgi:hypothetical protein
MMSAVRTKRKYSSFPQAWWTEHAAALVAVDADIKATVVLNFTPIAATRLHTVAHF